MFLQKVNDLFTFLPPKTQRKLNMICGRKKTRMNMLSAKFFLICIWTVEGGLVLESESLICFYTQAFITLHFCKSGFTSLGFLICELKIMVIATSRDFPQGFNECGSTFKKGLCKQGVLIFLLWECLIITFLYLVSFPYVRLSPRFAGSLHFHLQSIFSGNHRLQMRKPLKTPYSELFHLQVKNQTSIG